MLSFDFLWSSRPLHSKERRYHNGFLQNFYNLLDEIFLRNVPGIASNKNGLSAGWPHQARSWLILNGLLIFSSRTISARKKDTGLRPFSL